MPANRKLSVKPDPRPQSVSTEDPEEALTLRGILSSPILNGITLEAGEAGLHRFVSYVDTLNSWGATSRPRPHELLFAEPEADDSEADVVSTIRALDAAGASGLAVLGTDTAISRQPDVLNVANELAFPLLIGRSEMSLKALVENLATGPLARETWRRAQAQRSSETFLNAVLRGEGLAIIAQDLARLVDQPIVVLDTQGRVLAESRLASVAGADSWPRMELDVATSTVRCGQNILPCVAAPVPDGNDVQGYVAALGEDRVSRRLLDDLRNAATAAALALSKQGEARAIEFKNQSDLMHELIRGVDDVDDALRRSAAFGWDLDRRLIVLVLRLDNPSDVRAGELTRGPSLTSLIRQRIVERDPVAGVAKFNHELVILTRVFAGKGGRNRSTEFAASLAADAANWLRHSVSAGLSRPILDVRGVPKGYEQARRALFVGRDIQGDGAVAHFDNLGVYRVLSMVEDASELKEFAVEVLGDLADDTDRMRDLRRTLQEVLNSGGNLAAAARSLHYHYNTVRQRVDKIESIVGPFMSDPHARLCVELALVVMSTPRLRSAFGHTSR